jgi:hypothetical protein
MEYFVSSVPSHLISADSGTMVFAALVRGSDCADQFWVKPTTRISADSAGRHRLCRKAFSMKYLHTKSFVKKYLAEEFAVTL